MKEASLSNIRKNLMLMSVARGLVFWYGIEKLFQTRIGIIPEQIVLLGIVAQGSKVIFETPTSIFADRWNRRNVLIIANLSMICCCIILGLSSTLTVYIVGVLFWSLSDALSSGVYEAFTYDGLKSTGFKQHFKNIYTRMRSVELLCLAAAGIIAGVLGLHFNLRLSFFLSIIPSLASIYLLLKIEFPPLKFKKPKHSNWLSHTGESARVLMSPKVWWPGLIYISFVGFVCIWYEYYQLLGVSNRLNPFLFGSLITIITLGMMVGSEIAHRKAATAKMLTIVWILLLATHLIGLRFVSTFMVFLNLFITFIALQLQEIYLEIYLQDNIPSERRATVMSLMTTLGYAWFFILAGIFAVIIKPAGIRTTLTIVSIPLLIVGVIDIVRRTPWASGKKSQQLVEANIDEVAKA